MTSYDPRDKITIYLAGYIALRAEMLQRNALLYQIFSIAGILLLPAGVLVLTRSIHIGVSLGVVLTLILLVTFRFNKSDQLATAKRLEELRLQISRLANDELSKSKNAAGEPAVAYLPSFESVRQPAEALSLVLRRPWRRGAKHSS